MIRPQGLDFVRPFNEAIRTRIQVLVGSYVVRLGLVFDPVEIKMINQAILPGIIFIHNRKRGTLHRTPNAQSGTNLLDERCFACSHFAMKQPNGNIATKLKQFFGHLIQAGYIGALYKNRGRFHGAKLTIFAIKSPTHTTIPSNGLYFFEKLGL